MFAFTATNLGGLMHNKREVVCAKEKKIGFGNEVCLKPALVEGLGDLFCQW